MSDSPSGRLPGPPEPPAAPAGSLPRGRAFTLPVPTMTAFVIRGATSNRLVIKGARNSFPSRLALVRRPRKYKTVAGKRGGKRLMVDR